MSASTRRDRGEFEIGDNLGCLLVIAVITAAIVAVKIWGN